MIPQLIGTLHFPSTQPLNLGRLGPYTRDAGDFAYVVCCEIASNVAVPNLVAYRTPAQPDPNFGIVWTRVADGPSVKQDRGSAFYIGAGDVVQCGYQNTSFGISHVTFDMGAETFGTPDVVDAGGMFGISLATLMLVQLANGDLVCAYEDNGLGVFVNLFSSGVWSGRITVSASASARFNHAVVVSNTNIKVLWYLLSGGNVGSFHVSTFDGVSAISGTSTAYTVGGTDFVAPQVKAGWYDPGDDLVAWAFVLVHNGNAENEIFLLQGTASNVAPVFSAVSVYEDLDTTDSISATVQVLASTGGFTVGFILAPGTGDPDQIFTSTATGLAGPWSVPALYYDLNTDPPSPPPVTDSIFPLWSVDLVDGTPAFIIGLTQDIDTFEFCGTLYFLPVPSSATLRLIKSVSGGTAVPNMWLLKGLGPTTVSGAGDTGVVPVTPGTYPLSESAGPDHYTPSLYSCIKNGGSPVSGNSVVIAADDVVVCTITNTFVPPPFQASCPSPIYVVGTPYSSFVTVTGGVAPYTFALLSGSLPTGLSLNASTGEISGTPSAAGPFTFVIRATDSLGAHADTSSCSAGRCPGTRSII